MDYILYLRASTQRQGQSGLGLEGQRLIAHRFLQPPDRILSEYIEVESGRKHNRPEMAKAIVETRSAGRPCSWPRCRGWRAVSTSPRN